MGLGSKARRWLWLWLQERRRGRTDGEPAAPPDPLLEGLRQFYKPQAGASFVKSWDETAAVPNNPFGGMGTPYGLSSTGPYTVGDNVRYDVFPYGESLGQRIYAGAAILFAVTVEDANSVIDWPAWSQSPGWVTGYSVLRYVNGPYTDYRDVAAATMFAGWQDAGTGWSAPGALPRTFANPPVTAKVMWNEPNMGLGTGR